MKTKFNDFLNENIIDNDYSDIMKKCLKYNQLRNEIDIKYEQYVRCKIQDLVDNQEYFEAKNKVSRYYRESRLDNDGNFDSEFSPVLMGYENIQRDLSKLDRGIEIKTDFSSNCENINEETIISDYKKAIEYDSFIIKSGRELSDYIYDEINSLLKDSKIDEAMIKLDNFFKDSLEDKSDKRTSCFIEYDMLKANIIRQQMKNK